jgi:hypothetical protein
MAFRFQENVQRHPPLNPPMAEIGGGIGFKDGDHVAIIPFST